MDFNKLKNLINKNKSFILTTHLNPDADAIGSVLGMYHFLKKLGKEVEILNHNETPYNLEFLDPEKVIKVFDSKQHSKYFNSADVVMILDLNQLDRTKSLEPFIRDFKGIKVCIDHHMNPEQAFDEILDDTDYSATGEILFDFFRKSKMVELDKTIATPIYAAIYTDTGGFRFERTTARTHSIAGELLNLGVNPKEITDSIYDCNKISRFKLLSSAMNRMELYGNGSICYMIITYSDLKSSGAEESDVDGFVNYTLSVKGVQIGMLFYELDKGFKVSFRSKGNIPANELAAEFGGGGHVNAAGARLYGHDLKEDLPRILEMAEKYYEKFKNN